MIIQEQKNGKITGFQILTKQISNAMGIFIQSYELERKRLRSTVADNYDPSHESVGSYDKINVGYNRKMDNYIVSVNGVYITRVDIQKKEIEFMWVPESKAVRLSYDLMEYVKFYYPMAEVKLVKGIKEAK